MLNVQSNPGPERLRDCGRRVEDNAFHLGIEPGKPITAMRFRFIEEKTPNVQPPTPKIQPSELSVERLSASLPKLFHDDRRIPCDDSVRFNAFSHH